MILGHGPAFMCLYFNHCFNAGYGRSYRYCYAFAVLYVMDEGKIVAII